jgi:hypothetical protein
MTPRTHLGFRTPQGGGVPHKGGLPPLCYRILIDAREPEIAREMTSLWISAVPSQI